MRTLCFLALLLGSAGAATVKPVSLGQLAELSERVFVGTVQDLQVRRDGARIVTDVTFAVEHALKGDKSPAVTLTQLGGTLDGINQHVSGYPRFAKGERVLLFVERTDAGNLVVAGLSQGKFAVKTGPDGALVAQRNVKDLHFVNGRQAPDAVFAGTPAGQDTVALADVARLIEGDVRPTVFAPRVIRTPQVSIPEGGR